MPVMDEFKEARESIRNAPFEKKVQYFRDYYLMPLIVTLFFVGLGGAFIYNYFSQKETALYIAMVNFNSIRDSVKEMTQPFAEEHINTRRQQIYLDYSSFISADENEVNFLKYGYEDEQRLFSMVMTGEMDLFISGEDVVDRYCQQEWFEPLDQVLSSEDFSRYSEEKRILYRNEKPVAVRVDDAALLKEYFFYNGRQGETVYAAFPTNSIRRPLAAEFLAYLLK